MTRKATLLIEKLIILSFGAFLNVFSFFILNNKFSFHKEILKINNGISIAFGTSKIGAIFCFFVSILYFFSSIYSFSYHNNYTGFSRIRFHFLYGFSVLTSLLIGLSANLFTAIIFYETLTLSTYPLICFSKTKESIKAARKYLLYLLTPSLLLLIPSMMFIYYKCGNTNFSLNGILSDVGLNSMQIEILFLLTIYGVGKVALFPFYGWLPSAMIASVPVSGLLHAVAVVKSGIFISIMIICYIFGVDLLKNSLELFFGYNWFTWISCAGIVVPSLIALKKYDIKERLAYSTISHLSTILAILSTFEKNVAFLAIFYALSHGFAKIILFYSYGAIYKISNRTKIFEIDGLGNLLPFRFIGFFIGLLALIGFPGFVGYYSKHSILNLVLVTENLPILISIIISTCASVIYLGYIPYRGFCFALIENEVEIKKASIGVIFPVFIIILITVIMYFINLYQLII